MVAISNSKSISCPAVCPGVEQEFPPFHGMFVSIQPLLNYIKRYLYIWYILALLMGKIYLPSYKSLRGIKTLYNQIGEFFSNLIKTFPRMTIYLYIKHIQVRPHQFSFLFHDRIIIKRKQRENWNCNFLYFLSWTFMIFTFSPYILIALHSREIWKTTIPWINSIFEIWHLSWNHFTLQWTLVSPINCIG